MQAKANFTILLLTDVDKATSTRVIGTTLSSKEDKSNVDEAVAERPMFGLSNLTMSAFTLAELGRKSTIVSSAPFVSLYFV